MMKFIGFFFTLLIYGLVISGCGQKGPLFLPKKQTSPTIQKQEKLSIPQPLKKDHEKEQTEESPEV